MSGASRDYNRAERSFSRAPRACRKRKQAGETLLAYFLLLPSALILGAFGLLPLLYALLLSFRDWRLAPGGWVGLANYAQALWSGTESAEFWKSLAVTGWYVAGTVPLTLALGYLIAEMLHARLRGLSFYRTLFFMPYIVSPVAAAAVWRWILSPNFGAATAVAERFGWQPRWLEEPVGIFALLGQAAHVDLPEWAGGPSLALVCIIAFSVWQALGFAVVVLLAGMSAIPADVLDAAQLDGARGWTLMRRVKLPLLSPTLFFLLIVFVIRAFQTFSQIYVLTTPDPGGPAGSTRNVTLYIVQSFSDNAARLGPGYGSAVALLLFLIILLLTLLQFRVLGTRVHYGAAEG